MFKSEAVMRKSLIREELFAPSALKMWMSSTVFIQFCQQCLVTDLEITSTVTSMICYNFLQTKGKAEFVCDVLIGTRKLYKLLHALFHCMNFPGFDLLLHS